MHAGAAVGRAQLRVLGAGSPTPQQELTALCQQRLRGKRVAWAVWTGWTAGDALMARRVLHLRSCRGCLTGDGACSGAICDAPSVMLAAEHI